MGYSIHIVDKNNQTMKTANGEKHHIKGGIFILGGTDEASISITYNYSPYFYQYIDKEKGIRYLYGRKVKDTVPLLESIIKQMEESDDRDYWTATEGNARKALENLLLLAELFPDGYWDGD